MDLNRIYNESCITGIEKIGFPVHLVITSPPYNVDLGNNKLYKSKYDVYQDNLPLPDYLDFITEVFTRVYNKQEDDGRVAINVNFLKNGMIPMDAYYITLMEKIGYHCYTRIIWHKHQVGNRTSWGSYMSPSCPSFPTPIEQILVFYKNSKKLLRKGVTDILRQEFIDWSLSLWNFPPETQQKKIGHPAMFPQELPYRLIKLFSWIGDTVLDPFVGAGTTAMVAKRLYRNYVGFDVSKNYCDISEKRIDSVILNAV
jgi:site-specific DNA-methyltransferase (adenine-specific)